jgi:hypothetical protein
LDGVLAWRLLDPHLDGIVPEDVRQECRGHLEWLKEVGKPYWRESCEFAALLDHLGIQYVAIGGPGQYAPLGIDCWPRKWDDCDFDVHVESTADLERIAKASGATTVLRHSPGWWELALTGGTRISLASLLVSEHDAGESWSPFDFPTRHVAILGGEITVPSPVSYVFHMAASTAYAVLHNATQMPLWALARLRAWMDDPEWDWHAFARLLKHDISWTAGYARSRPDLAPHLRNAAAYCALWTLRMADRVYDVLSGHSADSLITPHPLLDPCPEVTERDGEGYVLHVLEWDNYPGDEAFLFNPAFRQGRAERVAAGVWKLHPDHRPEAFKQDEKGSRRNHLDGLA